MSLPMFHLTNTGMLRVWLALNNLDGAVARGVISPKSARPIYLHLDSVYRRN